MKKLTILLLILLSTPVSAGFNYSHEFTYFEKSKNLCYISLAAVKNNKELEQKPIHCGSAIRMETK